MKITLDEKKNRVLNRLENTLLATNSLLDDINGSIEEIINKNEALERLSDTFEIWRGKG